MARASRYPLVRLPAWAWLVAVAALGAAFRFAHYAANRSLWYDELAITLNLLDKPTDALFGPLELSGGAPAAWLLLEKGLVLAINGGEPVVRAVSLVGGLVALAAVVWLAHRLLAPLPGFVAVGAFAFSELAIYHSADVKPYATDAAAAALVAVGVLAARGREITAGRAAAFAACADVAMWFSYPAVFAVAAAGVALALRPVATRAVREVAWLGVAAVGATFAFLAHQWLMRDNQALRDAGAPGIFFPLPPDSRQDVRDTAFIIGTPFHLLTLPRVLTFAAVLVCLVGVRRLARIDAALAVVLGLTVAFAYVACLAQAYPFTYRTTLFTLPAVVMFLGAGTQAIVERLRAVRFAPVAAAALAAALLVPPLITAADRALHPLRREEIKPALAYLVRNWEQGDALFVTAIAQYSFWYYAKCDCFQPAEEAVRRGLWPITFIDPPLGPTRSVASAPPRLYVAQEHYAEAVPKLPSRPRLWVLNVRDAFDPTVLDRRGKRLDEFHAADTQLYLYDLADGRA